MEEKIFYLDHERINALERELNENPSIKKLNNV